MGIASARVPLSRVREQTIVLISSTQPLSRPLLTLAPAAYCRSLDRLLLPLLHRPLLHVRAHFLSELGAIEA